VTLIDGRPLAIEIRARAAVEVAELSARGVSPMLAALVATSDEATGWYVRSLARSAAETGIALRELRLEPGDAAGVLAALDELSADETVDGIVCLTPLPEGLSLASAGEHIRPSKDVDGANPLSLGRVLAGLPAFAPATARAVIEILRAHGTALSGAEAVVVGRSIVVGKPLALLLLAENATVTVCHSRTRELARVTRRAAVLVAAAGQSRLIGAEHVGERAIVIDVGTNLADDGGLVGDVDTAAVEHVAAAVTPVPGGVGPVTTAVLLRSVVSAARSRAGEPG
jgi:methylenetetrahydrofolate dehydrogenase (NADP+) / methenyltetrahydrofolate cyclohydrolase